MVRGAIMRTILVVESVLIIIGVILMCFMVKPAKTGNIIHIYLEDGKTQAVEFKDLSLIPGDSREYRIKLQGSLADGYMVRLNFVEEEEKTLKNFAYVKIIAEGEVLCDQLLAEAFEDDSMVLPVNFREEEYTDLTIIYYLPVEVGNEAKNAEAIFSLQFTPSEK